MYKRQEQGIPLAFPSKDELPQRAASGENSSPSDHAHTQEVPDSVSVGDRLSGETGDKLSGDQVADQCNGEDRDSAEKEVAFFKEDQLSLIHISL